MKQNCIFTFNYTANFSVYNSTLSKSMAELLLLDFNSSALDLNLLVVLLPAGASQLDLQDANLVPESCPQGPMGFPTRRKHWRQLRVMAPSPARLSGTCAHVLCVEGAGCDNEGGEGSAAIA